ncbi:MAG: Ig-like domain-containing protein [Phycisphaeraceae bacterium]
MSAVPVAMDDMASTAPDTPLVIDVTANDIDDAPIEPYALTILSGASHGIAFLDFDTGLVTYIPDPGFIGIDTFGYVVSDMDGNISNEAIVSINVDFPADPEPPPPEIEDVTFTAPSGFLKGGLTLQQNGGNLEIINSLSREILFSHAMDTISSLTIDASVTRGPMHLKLDLTGGSFDFAGGLHVIGNDLGRPDKIVITATGPDDVVTIDDNTVMVNGLTITLTEFEKLKVKTSEGMKVVHFGHHDKHAFKPIKACKALMAFDLKAKHHRA